MIVTTISPSSMSSMSLPDKISGQYWLHEEDGRRLVSIEGIGGQWILKSNRRVRICDKNNEIHKTSVLTAPGFYLLRKDSGELFSVLTEPATLDRQLFSKYGIWARDKLTVGRDSQNDICYSAGSVSAFHCVLSRVGENWYLQDQGSTNGTFVNEKRIQQGALYPGDTIFIMGLRIVLGYDFIACNDPDGLVRVTDTLKPYPVQEFRGSDPEEPYELQKKEYFYRSPRFKRDVETARFKIDPPPASPITEELPWILVMGSSMTMGVMSLITLTNAVIQHNITSMIMGGAMMLGMLVLPVATKCYDRNRKRKKEQLRQDLYRAYLTSMQEQIQDACRLQEKILNENSPSIRDCEARILNRLRNLWERSPGQNDFLSVRLGNGNGELNAELRYTEWKFTMTQDDLQDEQYALCEREKPLYNIPISYSLAENTVSGVIGERKRVVDFAKGLIFQLAALYSYDEVKFVFLYDGNEGEFGFTKWLPHVWSEDRQFRFLASTLGEVREVSAYFERIIEERQSMNDSDRENANPFYIVFALSKELSLRSELIRKVLSSREKLGISLICFYDELRDLPKECSKVVQLQEVTGVLFDRNDISGKHVPFTPDIHLENDPLALSVALANICLDSETGHFRLPGVLSFLEMLGVGKVEHLNALDRWREHDPVKSLRAEVGLDTYGNIFQLDLHEKFHGPHGLVAGMTGSGKSEFIITYILSMAVNYHPDEVAFILIDYKGGGTAKAFERLPHTAGIITNLDGAAIKRSLVSIESELKRRQKLFAAAGKQVGTSNIDIYKYQKLYREGKVSQPLQHLFIIADEFAELKTQQPEFMTQLVSTARIGRSLGIHLILATQKPSGVVDDQIWSNSRFRVCLKVQEKADSVDMLKRPEAAELKETGRFYLQVGYNELFEMGQSAWSGAPYVPSDLVEIKQDNGILVIDNNGHPVRQVMPAAKKPAGMKNMKQLDAVVEYLRETADREGVRARALWLEPIPALILLDQVRDKYGIRPEPFVLEPLVGEYDDPVHQQQCALRLPLSREGNAVIYGSSGSGKTSFLNAMICSLLREHTPDEVHLYLLDFASETLRAFGNAPHVGDVILNYQTEKIANLFKMLCEEFGSRRKQFAPWGGDYDSYLRASGNTAPAIVTFINNYAAFSELYSEQEEAVQYLTREGSKYGIFFVLTVPGTNALRLRLLQNFKQQLTLQLNDPTDYSSVVGKTDGMVPSRCKGRGLIRLDELYEFQTASLVREGNPYGAIQEWSGQLAADWAGKTARKIPILPEVVDTAFLQQYIDHSRPLSIPVGVEKSSLDVHLYPFGAFSLNLILSSGEECHHFAAHLVKLEERNETLQGIVFDVPGVVSDDSGRFRVAHSPRECEELLEEFCGLVLERFKANKNARNQGKEPEQHPPVLVILNSFAQLCGVLSEDSKKNLDTALLHCSTKLGISVLLAETYKGLTFCRTKDWYRNGALHDRGLWIGRGFSEQSELEAADSDSSLREELSAEYGYALVKGKCTRLKIPYCGQEELENG